MTDTEAKDLYRRALNLWGIAAQMRMAVEECAELQVAIMHGLRGRTSPTALDELCSEVADVQIMCAQLAAMLPDGEDRVEFQRQKKLKRLLGRVQTAEQVRNGDSE